MTVIKKLIQRHAALRDDIGELTTRRPLPGPGLDMLNPFLFLNHHGPQHYPPGNRGLPFGPHPHRGFETVTFILEGELAHLDSAGHESIIGPGGMQWMTAGSGLIHAEVSPQAFKRDGGALEILQLWVNLPARLKMTAPRYIGLQRDALPVVPTDDALGQVQLIAGTWRGVSGPVPALTEVFMSTVQLAQGGTVGFDDVQGRVVFLYVVRGAVRIGAEVVQQFNLAELSEAGERVEWTAETDALVLFGHADPIHEPAVSHGPFVMNTREEIVAAIADYQAGKFGDAPRV